tara:strand:+ start:112890 stop:113447 length:558 start_codon:yes stop_codon:yes gene_type:complete
MRQVDAVFTRSRKKLPIGGWAIQVWTTIYAFLKTGKWKWKDISHCAVRFHTRVFSSPHYYQASEGLVNYMSGVQFDKKHEVVRSYTIMLSDEMYKEIRNECHDEAGAPYGTMQNIGIFVTDVLSLIGIHMDNPCKKGRNCSELLYKKVIMKKLGVIDDVNSDKIKPHEVEAIILSHKAQLEVSAE